MEFLDETQAHIVRIADSCHAAAMSELWEDIVGNWGRVRAVAATRHAMFVIHEDGALYKIDPVAGTYLESIASGFDSDRLVAHGEQLFVFDRSSALYRVNPADGSSDQLAGTWLDVGAATSCGNRIYAVAQHELYSIDPETGDAELLPSTWHTRHLIGFGERLYAWEADNQLYRIAPETGHYEQLASTWAMTTGVATACGRLYAVDNGILYRVDEAGGYTEVGDRMRTRFLVGLHSCLYTFADNGDLYRIAVG